jgi:hypothetical protein
MQGIFAFEANVKEEINQGEKKLTASIESCYTLFCYFFSIFPEFKRYRLNKQEDLKGKIYPTFEDLNPNTKFVDNIVITQIEDNITLNKLWNQLSIHLNDQSDFIVQIFQEIAKCPAYIQYMENPTRSYEEDKKLVLAIIEDVFAQSEMLHWFLEEKNVHWFDDYNEALLMVYKNISNFTEIKGVNNKITPLYKDTIEDVEFFKTLYRKTLILGDTKLFLQGMGGPGAEILIPDATIAQLKNLYKNEKVGLLSAKIRLYSDGSLWNNSYSKPDTFTPVVKTVDTDNKVTYSFFPDKDVFAYSGVYKMVKGVDLDKNPAYYEISITQFVKNIIEKEEANKPISINIGSFQTSSSTGALLGTEYTTKAYTPNRIVLVGSDANNTQYKAQLKIIYSKK